METDEEIARRLQKEFNEEESRIRLQTQKDEEIAQELARSSHNLSDSDDDNDVVQLESTENEVTILNDTLAPSGSNGKVTLIDLHNEQSPSSSPSHSTEEISTNHSDSETQNKNDLDTDLDLNQSTTKRPLCKYGSKCYRKNPHHLKEFYHPESSSDDDVASVSEPRPKKIKKDEASNKNLFTQNASLPFVERHKMSEPFHFFLNKNFSVPETKNDWLTLVFPDLLNPKLGTLIESCQVNFMVDLNFVMDFYNAMKQDHRPILFVYGQMEGSAGQYPNVTCKKVNMPFQYGVHHSKMMLFHYEEGCRVIIHTANLIEDDWTEKTQGFWVSPLFPPLGNGKSSLLEGDSSTRFKHDLVDYLLSYKINELNKWSQIIKSHDLSSCNVFFIGSVPGYHVGENRFKFGHMKCRNLIRKYSTWGPRINYPVIVQCSSIGSLGKDNKSWLTSELGVSLSGGSDATVNSAVKVIYPSENDVKNSSQGYQGGSCLPYNSNTHSKQLWFQNHLHSWRSESRKRSKAMPHIKTFTRLSSDLKSAEYFMLTSSNLSKAAWGQIQKQGSQLFIRSYEAGVLFLPKIISMEDSFPINSSEKKPSLANLPLPYDLPLTPYSPKDHPWFMNTPKTDPDIFGNTYPSN